MQPINVKKFSDYRAFLHSHIQEKKQGNPHWSLGLWCQKLGLKDVSSIGKILKGDRHPGPKITEKLVSYFQFSEDESLYFKDLVQLQKVKNNSRLSVLLLEKMGKQYPDASFRRLDQQSFNLISNWYCFAIREMIRLDEFFEDPEWISKKLRFKTTPTETKQAIQLLIEVGLLKRDANGTLQLDSGRFHTDDDVANEAGKRFLEAGLDHAKSSLRSVPLDEREYTASVIPIKTTNLPEAKQLIREFKTKFCKIMEEDPGDSIYQVQIQFFPLTHRSKK